MFVKWSCGCVGFVAGGKSWVVNSCTREWSDPDHNLFERDMEDKTSEPLTDEQVKDLCWKLRDLLLDGFQFRTMKSILGIKPDK